MKKTIIFILCALTILVACNKKENAVNETKSPDKTFEEPLQSQKKHENESATEAEKNTKKKSPSAPANDPKNSTDKTEDDMNINDSNADDEGNAEESSDKPDDTGITSEDISSFLKGENPGLVDKVNGAAD